jgi:hypothetical protein
VTQKIKPKQIKPSTNSQTININSPIGYQFSYYFFEDQLHIREGILNDTLYIINNNKFSFDAKYIINAGKYEFTEEIFQIQDVKNFFDRVSSHIAVKSIFETKENLFLDYQYSNAQIFCYFSKKDNKLYYLNSSTGIPNDYDGGLDFWPMYQKNNELIAFYDAHLFKKNIDKSKKTALKGTKTAIDSVQKFSRNLDEEDNPVMVIVKLKKI